MDVKISCEMFCCWVMMIMESLGVLLAGDDSGNDDTCSRRSRSGVTEVALSKMRFN